MLFTPEQLHAIERREGEMLLDAAAGSGKTSVLVERFSRAICEDGIGVNAILTITFTEKAAAELRERIRGRLRALGDDEAARAAEGAWISTIHAFCARLLRIHALDAGLDPEFVVLDERDAAMLRSSAFDEALKVCALSDAGTDLIAAYGTRVLRSTIESTYAELRARGAQDPTLPMAPVPPTALDLCGACSLVRQLAAVLAGELGAVEDAGRRVLDALEMLELVPETVASGRPWPGDLDRIKLGNGATALRSQACDDYRAAVEELITMAAASYAVDARDALDALLQEYGRRYTALKRERSGLDFSDLELMARDLLRLREIAAQYRGRFARVMVDEMQDTNNVQLELIDLIAGPDLFMVGDAQQAIYGFRHADVELFAARGAQLEEIGSRGSLRTNFRSRPEILAALNGAFADALGERFRPLLPGRADGPAPDPVVELILVDKDALAEVSPDPLVEQLAAPWRVAEARAMAGRVRELIDAGDARAGDVVVLLRATTDMRVYEQALEERGVPTYVVGGRGYWAHPEVIELVAYLRALANPLDTEALYTVLLSPLCGLSLDGLVLHAAAAEELPASDRERLRRFQEWFERERRAAAWVGAERLLDRVLGWSGYELHLAALPNGRRRLANVRKLMRLAREWQGQHGSDLRGFVDLLLARGGAEGAKESDAPVESEALDAVRLMTIHRSKGLEFPVVCVADLGRQVLPRAGALVKVGRDGVSLGIRLKRPGDAQRVSALDYERLKAEERERELEEERRLFYVAMTRAQERLIVSGAAKLAAWDEGNRLAPIGWVGRAFDPDIATHAQADRSQFLTEHGLRLSFITTADRPVRPETGDGLRLQTPRVPLGSGSRAESDAHPAIASLSYTALATYERCPYRFYVQRVLGVPETLPSALDLGGPQDPTHAQSPGPLTGQTRGTLIHELLAGVDLRSPSLHETVPPDLRSELAAVFRSPTFARLAAMRDVQREQHFAFPLSGTLIAGIFDVLARETAVDSLLVVDYKSDNLAGSDPGRVVAERYAAQCTIYALAALKLEAAAVEVVHLFLQAPENPVVARFTQADAAILDADLAARVAGPLAGDFTVTGAPSSRVCDGCPARGGLCSYPLELTTR